MAKIEKDGEDMLLVFTEDELEWLGIETGMNVDIEVVKGRMIMTFQKEISADNAKELLPEIIENIKKRPWISYLIDKQAELISVIRKKH